MSTEQLLTFLHVVILIANMYCTSLILMSYISRKMPEIKRPADAFWHFTFDCLTLLVSLVHVATWAVDSNYSEDHNFIILARWGIATVLMFVWVWLRNRPSDKATFLN